MKKILTLILSLTLNLNSLTHVEQGVRLKSERVYSEGKCDYEYFYQYNSQGFVSNIITKSCDGREMFKTIYRYDSSNNIETCVRKDLHTDKPIVSKRYYYKDGKMKKWCVETYGTILTFIIDYTNENLITVNQYNHDTHEVTFSLEYVSNNLVLEEQKSIGSIFKQTFQYVYDKKENPYYNLFPSSFFYITRSKNNILLTGDKAHKVSYNKWDYPSVNIQEKKTINYFYEVF